MKALGSMLFGWLVLMGLGLVANGFSWPQQSALSCGVVFAGMLAFGWLVEKLLPGW